jgi:hypothetical protein
MLTYSCFFNSQEYLQFEIDESEFDRTRELYERLLDRTKHLKVWMSYAEFEASAGLDSEDSESEEKKNDDDYQEQQLERVRKCRGNLCDRAFYVVQPHDYLVTHCGLNITPFCFDDQLSLKGHLTTSEPMRQS